MRVRTLLLVGLLFLLTACTGETAELQPPSTTAALETEPEASTETPAPTEISIPTPTPLVEPREGRIFTYYGEGGSPIVSRGPDERWDGKFINPGGMIYNDGAFHMFRNGFKNWPGLVSVGYMTSPDGLTWTEVQEAPVFTSDQVPYVKEGDGADVSSVVIQEDGTWVFYFHTVSNNAPAVIGRATASSPFGPWVVDPEPVLVAGGDGAWDVNGVAWPNVIRTDSDYVMYYAGSPKGLGGTMIGLAVSADGLQWEKYDDPLTIGAPFAESDPVLKPDESWTTDGVDRAGVVQTPEGWVMIYQGGALIKRGLAFSPDGIHWTPHPQNPVIELPDFPLSGTMWDTSLVFHDDIYYYYTEIGNTTATNIYLAIHAGQIKPVGLPEP